MIRILMLMVCSFFSSQIVAESDRLKSVVMESITSKNHEAQQIAIRLAHVLYPSDPDFLNIAAEQLLAANRITNDRHEADLISWYIKYLGTSKTTKHLDMLIGIESQFENEKIKKYIDVVTRKLVELPSENEPYQPGQVELATIHIAAVEENRREQITNFEISLIGEGVPIEEVLSNLGSPDYIRGFRARTSRWGKSDLVSFHYRDKGVVVFSRNQLNYFTKGVVQPHVSLTYFPFSEEYPTAQLIAGLRGEDFRAFLKLNGRLIVKSPELMMLLCDRVTMNGAPVDKFEVAALQVSMRWIYHWKNDANLRCFQSILEANVHEDISEDAHAYLAKILKRQAIPKTEIESDVEEMEPAETEEG